MGTAETWLVVAAEAREFDGILKVFGKATKLDWRAQFAREVERDGQRWWFIANGPGPRLVDQALSEKRSVNAIVSTGFCGALDPALKIGDIVVEKHPGEIYSADRVAVTAAEKAELRSKTGAVAVEMEAAAVARKAKEWGVPFHCVRVVSDTADHDLPLDFNLYRDADGRFSRSRIALAAMMRPFTAIPGLLRLDRNCQIASQALGEFFAHCRL